MATRPHIDHLVYTGHALVQMFERRISRDEVRGVVRAGELIAEYPDDTPYPSWLILGFSKERPLHVVLACDPSTRIGYVVTTYEPSVARWEQDFKTRRKP